LSVCATAIGNSVTLNNGSFNSKPILWLGIIGPRGTGKTHPISWAKKPIEEQDTKNYLEYQSLMQEFEQKDKDTRGRKPHYSKVVRKDSTHENVAEALQHNEQGVFMFQDE